jgi:GNAT superfamily N-acetyltransferase
VYSPLLVVAMAGAIEPAATIREATVDDADAVARVNVDTWRTTYPGIIPDKVLAGLSYEEVARGYRRSLGDPASKACGLIGLLAEDPSGEVIGIALAGPTWEPSPTHTAEIRILYVRDAYQRHGVGRALVRAAVERLAARGHVSLLIWVFEANQPARRFYEALGGQLRGARTRQIRGFAVDEVAYGWDDLGSFVR